MRGCRKVFPSLQSLPAVGREGKGEVNSMAYIYNRQDQKELRKKLRKEK
jgi:hypothetical protein